MHQTWVPACSYKLSFYKKVCIIHIRHKVKTLNRYYRIASMRNINHLLYLIFVKSEKPWTECYSIILENFKSFYQSSQSRMVNKKYFKTFHLTSTSKFLGYRISYKRNTFISNVRLKLAKNWAKTKQHPEA